METKITYIAYDGTEFGDEAECEEYEEKHLSKQLSSNCLFLDIAKKPVTTEQFFNNPMGTDGIYVPNDQQARIVHQILKENELESPWDEDSNFTPGYYWYNYNGEYENVEYNLEYWQDIYNHFQEA